MEPVEEEPHQTDLEIYPGEKKERESSAPSLHSRQAIVNYFVNYFLNIMASFL